MMNKENSITENREREKRGAFPSRSLGMRNDENKEI
jgi:hypothetical protein